MANATNLLGHQIFSKILMKQKSEDMLKTNNSIRTQKKKLDELKQPEISKAPGTSKHSVLSRNEDLLLKDTGFKTARENKQYNSKLVKIEENNLEVRRSNEKLKKILQSWGKSKAKREENWLLKQTNGFMKIK